MVWRGAADRTAEGSRTLGKMEYLAHLGTAPQQVVARGLDVGNHQEHALGGSWCALAGLSEVNRALGSRRRELDCAVIAIAEVGVEPPAEAPIELLRAVDIRYRDGDHLELQVNLPDPRLGGCVLTSDCACAHTGLLARVWAQISPGDGRVIE